MVIHSFTVVFIHSFIRSFMRQVATARAAAAEEEVELTEAQDERGRALYGPAWDEPEVK